MNEENFEKANKPLEERLKSEGKLLRNSGSHSIKSLKDTLNINFEKFEGVFQSMRETILRQTEMLERDVNVNTEQLETQKRQEQIDELNDKKVKGKSRDKDGNEKEVEGFFERLTNTNFFGAGLMDMAGVFLKAATAAVATVSMTGIARDFLESFFNTAADNIAGIIGDIELGPIKFTEEAMKDIAGSLSSTIASSISWGVVMRFFGKKAGLAGLIGGALADLLPDSIDISSIPGMGENATLSGDVLAVIGGVLALKLPKLIKKVVSSAFGFVISGFSISALGKALGRGGKIAGTGATVAGKGVLGSVGKFFGNVFGFTTSRMSNAFSGVAMDADKAARAERDKTKKFGKEMSGKISSTGKQMRGAFRVSFGRIFALGMMLNSVVKASVSHSQKLQRLMEEGYTAEEALEKIRKDKLNQTEESLRRFSGWNWFEDTYNAIQDGARDMMGMDPVERDEPTQPTRKPKVNSIEETDIPTMVPGSDGQARKGFENFLGTIHLGDGENSEPSPGSSGRRERRESSARQYDEMLSASEQERKTAMNVMVQGGSKAFRGGDTNNSTTNVYNSTTDPSLRLDPFHLRAFG